MRQQHRRPVLLLLTLLCLRGSPDLAAQERAGGQTGPAMPPVAAGAALRVGIPALGAPLAYSGPDNRPRGLLVELWRLAEQDLGTLTITLCGAPADCLADLEAQALDLAGPIRVNENDAVHYSQPVLALSVAAKTTGAGPRDARVLRQAHVGLLDPFAESASSPTDDTCRQRECPTVARWRPESITVVPPAGAASLGEDVDVLLGPRALLLEEGGVEEAPARLFPVWRHWQYLASRIDDRVRLEAAEAAIRRIDMDAVAGLDGFSQAFGDLGEFSAVHDVPPLTHAEKLFLDRHPTIHLGASEWAPLTVIEDGEVHGLVIDSLRYHLQRLGVTPVFETGAWAEMVEQLNAGRLEGLGYVVSAERFRDDYELTDSLIRAPFVAAVGPRAPFIGSVDDLTGREVLLRADYGRLRPTIEERFPELDIRLVPAPADALAALLAGEAEAWFEFLPVVRNAVLREGSVQAQAIRPLETSLFDSMAMVLSRGRDLEPLVPLVNESISTAGAALEAVQGRWLDQVPPSQVGRRWVLWALVTLLVIGCAQLMRQLLRERARLRRNERALRRAQLLSGVGSIEIPAPYERVVMNGETPRLLGLDGRVGEHTLPDHLLLFEDDDAAQLEAAVHTARDHGRAGPVTLTTRGPQPRRFVYELSRPQRSDATRAPVLITLRDVTAQHEQERRQRALEREIVELQQLDALGRLAAGIAHDFNNVLVVIISSAELGLRRTEEGHPARRAFEQILESGLRSRELVKQLLNSVRPPAQERTRLDLGRVVAQTLALLVQSIPDGVRVERNVEVGEIPIDGNEVQLTQVFTNLVRNAVDAMPDGGVLTVTLARELAEDGPRALLSVRDTGIGMDDATREHIFQYFFSTRESGSGLGLAIVRNIVLAHGGTIEVVTAPGEGADFRIRIPLLVDSEGTDEGNTRRPRLLVVDDDAELLAAVSSGLRSCGYRVTARPGAAAALEVVQEAHEPFDAVLCDLTLPGTSGLELARKLKRSRPALLVILLADRGQREALAGEPAVDRVLDKRVGSDELRAVLDELLTNTPAAVG